MNNCLIRHKDLLTTVKSLLDRSYQEMPLDRLETLGLSLDDQVYGIMKLRALHGI